MLEKPYEELARYIAQAKKTTPVILYLKNKRPCTFAHAFVIGEQDQIVIGDYEDLQEELEAQKDNIVQMHMQEYGRNCALPLFPMHQAAARIEFGAVIRDRVSIGEQAVIMMGAIINVGAVIGNATMVDMGAVIGAKAQIGAYSHIGANAVIAGVLEPPSAKPVVIGDHVLIGANAVVLEGITIQDHAVVGAGAIVTKDVQQGEVVMGNPAKVVKRSDEVADTKIAIAEALRTIGSKEKN